MLDAEQLDAFGSDGQLTVPDLFSTEEIERALEDHSISLAALSIVMEANSNRTIHDAVARSVGVAFLSSHSAGPSDQVVPIQVRGFHPRRNIFLVLSSQRTLPAVARAFLTFVDTWRTAHTA